MTKPPMRPHVVWLTGLSGAGKTTLAKALQEQVPCMLLDGDEARRGISSDLGFSHADRTENIRRLAHMARWANEQGAVVLVAAISPYRQDREQAAQIIGAANFFEVHVATSIAECRRRDAKGLYAQADRGELKQFTGIDAPYEEPLNPSYRTHDPILQASEEALLLLAALQRTFAR